MSILIRKELQDRAMLGLYARPATSGLNPRYLREALNCDFRGGVAARRGGLRRINNTALSGTGYGLYYAKFNSGTRETIAAHGNLLSRVDREPTALTLALPTDASTLTGNVTHFAMLNDLVFMCNRTNNVKYNGTNVQKWGLEAPTAVGTVTESAAAVTSQRRYIAVFYNSTTQQEGPESPQSATINLDNEQASVATPAPATPTDGQINQWRLYAAIVTGGRPGVFYRVGTANTGTAIVDNLSDSSLQVRQPLQEFTNNAPAAAYRIIVTHQGRFLCVPANDRSIVEVTDHDGFFSKPESVPVLNYIPINYRDGDVITAIASLDEYAIFFKEFSIWAMIGSWPDIKIKAVSYRPDHTSLGSIEQKAIYVFDRGVVFPSHDGVYVLSKGNKVDETLFQTQRLSIPVDDFYAAIDQSATMHAVYDRSRRSYRLFCNFRTGQSPNAPVVT